MNPDPNSLPAPAPAEPQEALDRAAFLQAAAILTGAAAVGVVALAVSRSE